MKPVRSLIPLSEIYSENKRFFDVLNEEDLQQRMTKSHKFSYGNFDKYYNSNESDPNKTEVEERLRILPNEWFEGKKILDVGCNDGTFTLALTLNFCPDLVIGVDIDNKLISRAIKNIHKVTNDLLARSIIEGKNEDVKIDEEIKQGEEGDSQKNAILAALEALPRSLRLSLSLPRVMKALDHTKLETKVSKRAKDFLYERLSFRTENFIANLEQPFEKYDVILCLKTVKWIHLNFGDIAIKALFHKAYESLEPNGLFILDNPNWKGYKKRKGMNEDLKKNFENITFRPSEFDKYLKEKVGFSWAGDLKFSTDENNHKRPLLVYKKVVE